ncbi:MAG: phosphoribosylaminoimidazolesuccinocarboxamide synthase [Thermodesulfobacteriota bacterium]|nr:phosphoribosylaminoimidazolesuccinocarboxamide synthase [Thermodesulfobacteriota bacterium]
MNILTDINLSGVNKKTSGKVREIFEIDKEQLLIVTTDRISAFDVVLKDPIPNKGLVLNQLSLFWFEKIRPIIPNHVVASKIERFPAPFNSDSRLLGRSMLVKKAKPLPVECVVRGYLAGSGWKEYKQKGSISGIKLPEGMVESQKLEEPIFTPTTKAEIGQHDESIDMDTAARTVGASLIRRIRDISIRIYRMACEFALGKGILIADTKFEFGLIGDTLILIDEALTPDSSRFWPLESYEPGNPQPSFDKQFVRDYLDSLDWDKKPPSPSLPKGVIEKTSEKYIEAYERLTGRLFRDNKEFR